MLGGLLLGWRTICAVELDAYCRSVLLARQRDGVLGQFPIWDDVRTFDGRPWRGHVDVISGGFPCQDISAAGRGAGLAGTRSGLWREFARVIGEVEPAYVFVENSPLLRTRGLVTVLQDLAGLGFDARWGVLGADDAGACQTRKRMWVVANAASDEGRANDPSVPRSCGSLGAQEAGERRPRRPGGGDSQSGLGIGWWSVEPNLGRVAHGVAVGVERHRAIANGQVPAVAALAWRILK